MCCSIESIWMSNLHLASMLDQEMIDAELAADHESASSEWLGQFRSSTVQFLDDELIEAAIVLGCQERPFERRDYFAFTDPSGGRHDAFTLSISHRDGERVVCADHLARSRPHG